MEGISGLFMASKNEAWKIFLGLKSKDQFEAICETLTRLYLSKLRLGMRGMQLSVQVKAISHSASVLYRLAYKADRFSL